MLETMNPVLKDRLLALGTFSGIAVAAVAGFELVIGGGFDFLLPSQETRQVAPTSYVHVVAGPWAEQTRLAPLSSNEYMFAGEDAPASDERLAGGWDSSDAPHGSVPEVSEDELYANIEALYQRQHTREVQVDPEPVAQEDEPYVLYVDEKKPDEAATY